MGQPRQLVLEVDMDLQEQGGQSFKERSVDSIMVAEFRQLHVGDVRKRGDQVRQLWTVNRAYGVNVSTAPPNPGEWDSVKLFDWPILMSDLFNAEFRRPLI